MNASPDNPGRSDGGPRDEEDTYAIREPVEQPKEDFRQILMTSRVPVDTVEPLPPPPSLPFLTGVFTFLFYLKTMAVWLLGSIGLIIGLLLTLYCVYLVEIGLAIAARCLAFPALWLQSDR